ncbi:MAG: hypothetical protein V1707_00775 [bacterium]
MTKDGKRLIRDFLVVALSIGLAVLAVRSGLVHDWLVNVQEWRYFGTFIAGLFFTSIFTVAPATAVLAEIAQDGNLWLTAVIGGLGALVGDYFLFWLVRDHLTDDFLGLFPRKSLHHALRLARVRWLLVVLGAIVVASPLPDELGLAMMGFSKLEHKWFIPLSWAMNSLGILAIGVIARAL